MNKDQALWVVIRAMGLVFLVMAIICLPKLVSVGVYWEFISEFSESATSEDGSRVAITSAKSILLNNMSELFLYGVSAFYFMRKGKFVHRVISH